MGNRLALALCCLATVACVTAPVGPSRETDEPETTPNLARAISESSGQLCVLHEHGDVWCSDGETQRHVDLHATQIVAALVDDGYDPNRDTLTCARTSEGRVVCWDRAWAFSVIPDIYGAVELAAGLGGVCATTRRGDVACFDRARIPRWDDGSGERPAPGVDFSSELSSRCTLGPDRRVLCHVMDHQDHALQAELGPDASSKPLSPEQLGLVFTEDPWARWATLRRADFDKPADRSDLALQLLAAEPLRCLVREDSNSLYVWPEPSDAAGIYNGCWRHELFGWALTQVSPAQLRERFDGLCESIDEFDHPRWEALAEHAELLEPEARLQLAERLWSHPRLRDSVVAILEHDQLPEALARGLDAALEHMVLPDHAAELRAGVGDPRLARRHRLVALENFEDPLDEQLMRELVDDPDCAVAMRAATVLAEAGVADLRPRLDRRRDLGPEDVAEVLCRVSWDRDYALAQYAGLLRGHNVPLFAADPEFAIEPRPIGKFTASHALMRVDRFECDERATCKLWLEQSYDVDPYSAAYDLAMSSEWRYYELRFERKQRGVRLVEVYEIRETDCTNC